MADAVRTYPQKDTLHVRKNITLPLSTQTLWPPVLSSFRSGPASGNGGR